MNRAIQIAKLALLIACTLLALGLLLATLQLREDIDVITNNVVGVAEHFVHLERDADDAVNDFHDGGRKALKEVNRPCKGKDCGILASANKLLIKGGDVIVTTQLNENREAALLEVQLPALMSHVNATADQAQSAFAAYQKTGEALTSVANEMLPVEANAARTLKDADAAIANPQIPLLLTHADETLAGTASMAKHGDAAAGDVQQAVHSWLHPGWKTRVTNWTLQIGRAVAGYF